MKHWTLLESHLLTPVKAPKNNNLETPFIATKIIMMAQEPKVMITCPSSKEDSNRALSWYARSAKEKEPGPRKASTRKVIITEARPMSDIHGKCQTLLQGTLPEQGGT